MYINKFAQFQSTGAMAAEQIVDIAFEVLEGKLAEIMTETCKLEGFKRDELNDQRFDSDDKRNIKRERGGWDEGFVLDLS